MTVPDLTGYKPNLTATFRLDACPQCKRRFPHDDFEAAPREDCPVCHGKPLRVIALRSWTLTNPTVWPEMIVEVGLEVWRLLRCKDVEAGPILRPS